MEPIATNYSLAKVFHVNKELSGYNCLKCNYIQQMTSTRYTFGKKLNLEGTAQSQPFMEVYGELWYVCFCGFGEMCLKHFPQLWNHGLRSHLMSNCATMTQNVRPWTISLSQC